MHIVIVKLSALGDILQTLDILPRIMAVFPQCKIDWVIEKKFQDALRNHPGINTIIPVDSKELRRRPTLCAIRELMQKLRRVHYNILIDLQGNCKSGCVNLFIRAKSKHGFSIFSVAEWPNILTTTYQYDLRSIPSIREKNLAFIEKVFKRSFTDSKRISIFPLKPYEKKRLEKYRGKLSLHRMVVMICPFSKWPNKMVSNFFLLQFLRSIREFRTMQYVFVWESMEQRKIVEEWIYSLKSSDFSIGNLSIPLWYHLMLESSLVIGVDSSSLHLASIGRVPTYTFFGPSKADVFTPNRNQHGYYQSTCPYNITFKKRCPLLRTCKDGACLKMLEVKKVVAHFFEWQKKIFSI